MRIPAFFTTGVMVGEKTDSATSPRCIAISRSLSSPTSGPD